MEFLSLKLWHPKILLPNATLRRAAVTCTIWVAAIEASNSCRRQALLAYWVERVCHKWKVMGSVSALCDFTGLLCLHAEAMEYSLENSAKIA